MGSSRTHNIKIGLIVCDALILALCAFAALLTKYAPNIEPDVLKDMLRWLPGLVGIYLLINAVFGMYRVLWKYADSYQLLKQGMAVVVAFGVTFIINAVLSLINDYRPLSNNYLITYVMFSEACVLASRLIMQNIGQHKLAGNLTPGLDGRRVLVVGAGDAGAHIVEMFQKNRDSMGTVAAIVDDDPDKRGFRIGDIPVMGEVSDIPSLAVSEDISDIIIALPTASKQRLSEITEVCLGTGCYVRVMDRLKHVTEE
ncbi:MAG: hypothetical protein II920_04350 [Clostridia bacterium]|nr:hypothetical protein [Clostridia bacterium]